eukprot:sb/3477298/
MRLRRGRTNGMTMRKISRSEIICNNGNPRQTTGVLVLENPIEMRTRKKKTAEQGFEAFKQQDDEEDEEEFNFSKFSSGRAGAVTEKKKSSEPSKLIGLGAAASFGKSSE